MSDSNLKSKHIVKRATVENAEEILRLQKKAYQSEAIIYNDFSLPPLVQNLDELIKDFDRHIFYCAWLNNKIVASVNVYIDEGLAKIGRLIVEPSLQGQGLGKFLLSYAEKTSYPIERFQLFTGHLSERNLNFYRNFGYVETERKRIHAGLELIYMEKNTNSNC